MINSLPLLLLLLRRTGRLSSTAHIQQRGPNWNKRLPTLYFYVRLTPEGGSRFLRCQNTVGTEQIWSFLAWDVSVWLNRFKNSASLLREMQSGDFCACAVGSDEACLKEKVIYLDGDELLTFKKKKWKCRWRYYRSDPLWCPSSLTRRVFKTPRFDHFLRGQEVLLCSLHEHGLPTLPTFHMEEKTWRNVANVLTQKYI